MDLIIYCDFPIYCRGIFDVNIDTFMEKPWNVPRVDMTDYFNFGFNESTWKLYCASLVGILLCPRSVLAITLVSWFLCLDAHKLFIRFPC